jgi:hypothetical protein
MIQLFVEWATCAIFATRRNSGRQMSLPSARSDFYGTDNFQNISVDTKVSCFVPFTRALMSAIFLVFSKWPEYRSQMAL